MNNFLNNYWAIKREAYSHLKHELTADKILEFNSLESPKSKIRKENNVAVIEIAGPVFRYETIWTWLNGGCSIERLMEQFDTAMEDESVGAIVLDVNSPGGEFDGAPLFADAIFRSKGKKPILSYISRMAASAGYWIASASDFVVMHNSAEAGCIGVLMRFMDEQDESRTISSQVSPKKVIDLNTNEGVDQVQSYVNKLGLIFVESVAKNRGVSVDKVISDFGQGDVIVGADALTAGMVDSLGNFKDTISLAADLATKNNGGIMSKIVAQDEKEKMPEAPKDEPKAESIEVDQITLDWLMETLPELVEEIKELGREEERKRMEEIDDVESDEDMMAEAEAIRREARQNPKMSALEVAKKILEASVAARKKQLSDIRADAKIEPVQSQTDEDRSKNERQKLFEYGLKIMNRHRRSA